MAKNIRFSMLTKKSSHFLRFYTVFVWVLVIAIIVGWFILHKTLSDYENNLPATYAKNIIRETQAGDFSSLKLLEQGELDALKSYVSDHGLPFAEAKELSREKGDYTFRITSKGVGIVEFTLTPAGDYWNMVSAVVCDSVKENYLEAFSEKITKDVKTQIASCDYSKLHPLLASTGYQEDTAEAFGAFMRKNTPDEESISFVRNDVNDKHGYDIIFSNSRFGHVSMSQKNGAWQPEEFTVSSALMDSYVLFLADEKANGILNMVRTLESESLYALCTENGYPAGHLSGFESLLRSIASIESATCSLFENSDTVTRGYLISTDEKRILSLTLSAQQSGDHKTWAITSFEMPVWVPFEGTITAPACFAVTVDGKMLTSQDEVKRGLQKNIDHYLVERVPDMVTDVTYLVKSPFPPQEMRAVCSDGREGALTKLDDGNYRFDLPYCDEEYKDELYDFLLRFAETFGLFTINDAPTYNSMMEFVERNSSAYTYVYKGDYYWVKDHYEDKTTFANFETDNFVRYDNQTIACDIRYEMTVVYQRGDTAETSYPAYRVYLRNVNGQWKIFSFSTLSDV